MEKRLADERLYEELNLPDQSLAEETSRPENRQDISPATSVRRPEVPVRAEALDAAAASNTITNTVPAEPVYPKTQEPAIEDINPSPPVAEEAIEDPQDQTSSAADHTPSRTVEGEVTRNHIEIMICSLERGEWKRSDRLHIDPSDPSLLERVAQKYFWKNYSLYDRNLHSLRPTQCFCAATADGSNALFVVSEYEEKKLAKEGRLVKEKNLLRMTSRVLDRIQDSRDPRRS